MNQITIIGGGPAGITAAIQMKRYGLEPLLLEKLEPGGLLWNANLVENYPGFPNGITGAKLIGLMIKQMDRFGVEVRGEQVLRVDWKGDHFHLQTDCAIRSAQYLIVASGTQAKPLPDIISPEARGRVFTEVRPLAQVTGRRVVVIGAGDAAFDFALSLSKKRNFVTIVNRGENVKCLPLLFERAARDWRILYRAGIAVSGIEFNEIANCLMVRSEVQTFEADYVLFAIGRVPNLDFLSKTIRRRESGLVESGRLYFVGDVKNGLYRQVAIAAGDGLRAAMQIYARIRE